MPVARCCCCLQCHRLRNEAAYAQHKEQEIGKQTRQALLENDALSRTVERLQRSFGGAGKASLAVEKKIARSKIFVTDRILSTNKTTRLALLMEARKCALLFAR